MGKPRRRRMKEDEAHTRGIRVGKDFAEKILLLSDKVTCIRSLLEENEAFATAFRSEFNFVTDDTQAFERLIHDLRFLGGSRPLEVAEVKPQVM